MVSLLSAQNKEFREVNPFNAIEISGSAQVFFTVTDTISLSVLANADDYKDVIATNQEDILIIKNKGSQINSYKVYVSAPSVKKITLSGAAKFTSLNAIKTDSLLVEASGTSDMTLTINTSRVDVLLRDAATLSIDGITKNHTSKISGTSTLKAYKLISTVTNINTSGTSLANVFANDKVNASATDASSIKIKGEPKELSAEASSASSITKVVDEKLSTGVKNTDSTTFNFKSKRFIIIDKEKEEKKTRIKDGDFHHWSGLGFGINGYTSKNGFTMPPNQKHMELNYGRSFSFQFNPFQKNIHLYKNYINLVTGLGFEWNHYEFNNSTTLNPDNVNYTTGMIDTTGIVFYKKNRLNTCYLNVPLLLEFNTNKKPSKSFHVAFGLVAGYILNSKTKQVIKDKADVFKQTRKDSYNLNPWRFNAYASIGYHNVTLFATYAINPLFKSDKGPELNPFTVGIKIINF